MGTKGSGRASKALSGLSSFMLGPWAAAIGTAVAVFGMFVAQQAEARAKTEQLTDTLDRQTGAVTEGTRAFLANELQLTGAFDTAEKLGISQSDLVDAILSGNDAIVLQNDKVLELAGNSSNLSEEEKALLQSSQELRFQILDLNGTYADSVEASENRRAAIDGESEASATASGEALHLAETLGVTTEAAQATSDQFEELDQRVRALIDSAFALSGAERDVEAGLDAVTEKLEENGATTNRNTEAGRANEQAIEDQIAAIAQLAVTTAEQTGSAEEANAVLSEQRSRLENVMRAAGFTEDQIDDYTDALDDVPGLIETTVDANFNVNITRTERINRLINEGFIPPGFADGGLVGFPDGGLFRGVGGPRSDSNVIAVSDGEFIVNAEATAENRELLEAVNSGQKVSAHRRHSPAGRHGAGGAAANGTVLVTVDFAGASDALARGLEDLVRVRGNGNVQVAFGSS
jgi:hypothetical protein